MEQLEKDLHIKLKEVKTERQKLDKALDNQRDHKEVHDKFLTQLKRLNSDFTEIPTGFKFTKIKDKSKYNEVLERIENLWEQNANTLSSKLVILCYLCCVFK